MLYRANWHDWAIEAMWTLKVSWPQSLHPSFRQTLWPWVELILVGEQAEQSRAFKAVSPWSTQSMSLSSKMVWSTLFKNMRIIRVSIGCHCYSEQGCFCTVVLSLARLKILLYAVSVNIWKHLSKLAEIVQLNHPKPFAVSTIFPQKNNLTEEAICRYCREWDFLTMLTMDT